MTSNPFLPSPPDAAAWAEGFLKGLLAGGNPSASEAVDQQSMEAFLQGVAAGEDGAANGLDIGDPCVSAAEGEFSTPGLVFEGGSLIKGVVFGPARLMHGLAGLFVLFIEVAVNTPHRTEDPATVLAQIGTSLSDGMAAFGIDAREFFVGAAADPLAEGCEIKLTPMFLSQEQATEAVQALGRDLWIVGGWRTDQTNSFRVVDEAVS